MPAHTLIAVPDSTDQMHDSNSPDPHMRLGQKRQKLSTRTAMAMMTAMSTLGATRHSNIGVARSRGSKLESMVQRFSLAIRWPPAGHRGGTETVSVCSACAVDTPLRRAYGRGVSSITRLASLQEPLDMLARKQLASLQVFLSVNVHACITSCCCLWLLVS